MKFLFRQLFYVGLMPVAFWWSGAQDKYPEFGLPLLLIWLAVIEPHLVHNYYSDYKIRDLEKKRKVAEKYKDQDLVAAIDSHIQERYDAQTPVTLAMLKRQFGRYEGCISEWDIDARLKVYEYDAQIPENPPKQAP